MWSTCSEQNNDWVKPRASFNNHMRHPWHPSNHETISSQNMVSKPLHKKSLNITIAATCASDFQGQQPLGTSVLWWIVMTPHNESGVVSCCTQNRIDTTELITRCFASLCMLIRRWPLLHLESLLGVLHIGVITSACSSTKDRREKIDCTSVHNYKCCLIHWRSSWHNQQHHSPHRHCRKQLKRMKSSIKSPVMESGCPCEFGRCKWLQ